MTINADHRAAAQAAIQQIAEIQAMHAELTEKVNETFRYIDLMKARVNEQVIPAIHQAVGDDAVEAGANALAFMQQHAETQCTEAMGVLAGIRDDNMGGTAFGLTIQAVAELERFSTGF